MASAVQALCSRSCHILVHPMLQRQLETFGLVSTVLFSLYVNDMPTPSRHVQLALYAQPTTTSRSPVLLVTYLETYLSRPESWLQDEWIAINVSKSTTTVCAKTTRCVQIPRTVTFFGQKIQCVETARYHGVTLDTRLTWSAHVNQVRRKAAR
jgi:hypothetical protein